ncbi:MAG: hypothetical protein U1D67_08200, partial [Dehalococcoidia bacterium]|nr:hypothetical protein [Dehalococcoidia bacterium]
MEKLFKVLGELLRAFSRRSAPIPSQPVPVVVPSQPVLVPVPPIPPLLPEVVKKKWNVPIRADKFKVTQRFLNPDPFYERTKHHPGTDYGTQGEDNVPLYFCADGEVIE